MLIALAAGGTASAAVAAVPHQSPGRTAATSAVFHPRFRFNFDQGESLRSGTRVADVTGQHHYGVVRTSGRGHLSVEKGVHGKAAGYHPRRACRCGKAIIQIKRNVHLNPFRHPFTFGASVQVRPRQAKPGRDPNIVQKGLYSQRGTQWKLQLVGANPDCVFNGSKGVVTVLSPAAIDDGSWHRLACTRVRNVYTLKVDGVVQGTGTGRIGRIANSASVTVGGRALGHSASNDQYHGNLDNVYLKVGRLR